MEDEREELQKKLKWYENKFGPYYESRGLKNWKNLFRKPTLMEWTLLLVIVLGLFGAWAYLSDTENCRETLENLPREVCEACEEFHINKAKYDLENPPIEGFGDLNFLNDTEVGR